MNDSAPDPRVEPAPSRAPGARRGRIVLTTLVAIAAAWIGIGPRGRIDARQAANPAASRRIADELVAEQLKLARRALKLIESSRQIGAPVVASSQERYLWSRRELEAEIYLSLGPDEIKAEDVEVYLSLAKGPPVAARVAAFQGHLDRMRVTEQLYRPLFENGQFSAFNFATVEYNRIQAEVWLSRESQRGNPPR